MINRRRKDVFEYLSILVALMLLAVVSGLFSVRIDLTADKRHSLSNPTKEILASIDDDIYIQIFLDGEMPIGFKRLKRSVRAMIEEFRGRSQNRVDFLFINPSEADSDADRERYQNELISKGLIPVNVQVGDDEGGHKEKIIFPGMLVNYNGIEMPVNFLKNNQAISAEQNLLNTIEGLEYELIQAISTISSDTIYKVAFLEGQGELEEVEVADLTLELAKYFTVDRGVIAGQQGILDDYAAIIIAKPTVAFTEEDKLVIDQYIMKGGRVLWLIDEVNVESDSLVLGGTMALYQPLNIEDQLFKYGLRINPVLIQDTDCMIIPVRSGFRNEQQQFIPVPWIYYPLLYPSNRSPVTRNINKVKGEFVNYIDTVGENKSIKKVTLLASSPSSRIVSPPRHISLDEYKNPLPEELFNHSYLPVAVLLEGEFTSLYKNRINVYNNQKLKELSEHTRMIVIADGDIIRNEVSRLGNRITPLPLGQDRYTLNTFGNKDFLVNCLNYLVDEDGIIHLRSREIRMRVLDRERIKNERIFWQLLNTGGTVLLVILAGILYSWVRKLRYAK